MAKRRGPGEGSIVKRKTCTNCRKVSASSCESDHKACKHCGEQLLSQGLWMGAVMIGFDVEKNKPTRILTKT